VNPRERKRERAIFLEEKSVRVEGGKFQDHILKIFLSGLFKGENEYRLGGGPRGGCTSKPRRGQKGIWGGREKTQISRGECLLKRFVGILGEGAVWPCYGRGESGFFGNAH